MMEELHTDSIDGAHEPKQSLSEEMDLRASVAPLSVTHGWMVDL
jgi:hypothetical protein